MEIRTMRPDEFDEMREVSFAAFGDDASIRLLLDTMHTSWGWRDDLSFVAVDGGRIVGQVLYSTAWVDAPERLVEVLLLSPIGVLPELHRSGIGRQLMRHSLDVIERERPEPLVFLEGHPSYYPQFGFRPGAELGFTAPSARIPGPAFMVRPLRAVDPTITGALVYPDVFWRTDTVGLR